MESVRINGSHGVCSIYNIAEMETLPLATMPDTALEKTLLFLGFEAIARLRRINRRFNTLCKSLLNKGFRNAEKYHLKCLKVGVRKVKLVQTFSGREGQAT